MFVLNGYSECGTEPQIRRSGHSTFGCESLAERAIWDSLTNAIQVFVTAHIHSVADKDGIRTKRLQLIAGNFGILSSAFDHNRDTLSAA